MFPLVTQIISSHVGNVNKFPFVETRPRSENGNTVSDFGAIRDFSAQNRRPVSVSGAANSKNGYATPKTDSSRLFLHLRDRQLNERKTHGIDQQEQANVEQERHCSLNRPGN